MEFPGSIQLDDVKKEPQKLFDAIAKAMGESKILKSSIEEQAEKNFAWWQRGTSETSYDLFHPSKSRAIDNRIFTNLESIIPVWTSNTPDATIMNVDNTIREKLANALKNAYEVDQKMNKKLQKMLRNWAIDRIGVFKYRWDKEKLDDGFTTEVVLSKKIGFDPKARSLENCDFIWEEMEKSPKEIARIFNKEEQLKQFYPELKGKAKYYEVWAGRGAFVLWVIPEFQIVLDAMENPNFNREEKAKDPTVQPVPVRNIFKQPKFPYLIFNVFDRADESGLYDDTGLIEQATPLQVEVNRLERQISELIEGQKRVWAISADAMSEDKAQQIVNKTGDLVVYYDRGTPNGGIQLPISGKPDASYYTYLQHLLSEIDNVMGVHSVTRGEPGQGRQENTKGGQQMRLMSDTSRSDMIVRNIEGVIEDWYLAFLQMHLVYSINGIAFESNRKKEVLMRDEIPTEVKIMVKKGSTLPADDRTRMDMAIQLGKMGMIDPKTLFEELGYGNEDQRVQALFQWLAATGKINPAAVAPPGAPQGPQAGVQGQTAQQPQVRTEHPLDQISQLLNSPDFKKLSSQAQKQIIDRIKQLLATMKQGQPAQQPQSVTA